jgi:hypothetical protein
MFHKEPAGFITATGRSHEQVYHPRKDVLDHRN